jgi:hypothetical protein
MRLHSRGEQSRAGTAKESEAQMKYKESMGQTVLWQQSVPHRLM